MTSNWRTLGESDGASGRPDYFVAEHQAACSRHGIAPDVGAWRAGWQDGIATFCTPENGARLGAEGRSYQNSCPLDLKDGFERPYRAYKRVHDAEQRVGDLRGRIDRMRDEIEDEKKEREKRRELRRLRDDLWKAEGNLRRAENDLLIERFARAAG
ncbi:DUF2799 domain-containing protein [Aurantimonas sp. A2-1-M11]|uniref:DUF2799 domain-containing protein n=1 Tax=Aurantimonas sp. A2-1-M11 TaxID=3113712 RepID=UPI002F952C74